MEWLQLLGYSYTLSKSSSLKWLKKKSWLLEFNAFCGIVVSPLPKSLLEMQALGPIPKLLNPNLHFKKSPKLPIYTWKNKECTLLCKVKMAQPCLTLCDPMDNTVYERIPWRVEFSSAAQSCLTLYDPMDYNTPGFPAITNSQSLLTLMSIESVMPSNHLILSFHSPLAFNLSQHQGLFPMSQFLGSGGHSIRVSASTSVLPMNIQDWLPLELTGLISLQSKGLSRVFSNTTVQKHQFFGVQLSL